MTKKDYVLIASSLKIAHGALMYGTVNAGETNRAIEIVAEVLASELQKENEKFNRDIFLRECGITNN